ncbi:MAG: hypothetical protein CML06_07215 [Pseudomonadales bacterium]|nr:hypothetical protein [Pseudomonadales bacterium]
MKTMAHTGDFVTAIKRHDHSRLNYTDGITEIAASSAGNARVRWTDFKIVKKQESFSAAVVGCLAPLLSPAARAMDEVEVLYEGGRSSWFEHSYWVALVLGILLLVVALLWALYHYFRQALLDREEVLDSIRERLQEAQAIARVGSWSRDFSTGQTFWSDEARQVLGMEAGATGFHYESLIHPADRERVTEAVASAYVTGGVYHCDHRVRCPNGQEKYVHLAGQVFLGDGYTPVRETATVQDITDTKLAEMAQQRNEHRMQAILDAAPYPILIVELVEEYPVLYANQSAFELFDIDPNTPCDELRSREFWSRREDRTGFFHDLQQQQRLLDQQMLLQVQSGRTFWAALTGNLMDFAGVKAAFISIMDITERKRLQQELERLTITDPLTGVLNRRSFFEFAHKEQRRACRYQQPLVMLLMDIDRLKQCNEHFGNAFGDSVLRRFAEVARDNLREEDVLGRVGGEEFCALLVASPEGGGYLVAERIRRRWMEEVFTYDGQALSFTVSIGVTANIDEREQVEDLMERADAGLNAAKHAGRNCVIVQSGDGRRPHIHSGKP